LQRLWYRQIRILFRRHLRPMWRRCQLRFSFAWRRWCRHPLARFQWRTLLNVALALTALYFFAGWFQPPVEQLSERPQITVWRADLNRAEVMDIEEYIKGVVAAEMPASFAFEALKAQAVAARTFTINAIIKGKSVPGHPEAVVSTDPSVSQAWVSEASLRRRYNFLEFYWRWRKINKAVDDTCGQVLTYEGEPILAVYHADSGGCTENSENYWSSAVPYLRSVEDPYALPDAVVVEKPLNVVMATKGTASAEAVAVMSKVGQASSAVEVVERFPSGRVKWVYIGGKIVSGRVLRETLGLRSNWFDVTVNGQVVVFSQRGYGHGVGMPQNGADGWARQGATYEQILHHYYSGVQLVQWY